MPPPAVCAGPLGMGEGTLGGAQHGSHDHREGGGTATHQGTESAAHLGDWWRLAGRPQILGVLQDLHAGQP